MGRLLVHIATGPENSTRAALGLLVARTALAGGHSVDVFLVGDGSLREHHDALIDGGAGLWASGMSAKARGIDGGVIGDRPIQLAPPDKLVELAFAADRVITY